MPNKNTRTAVERLTFAASQLVPAMGRKPWDYGWAFEDYRRSPRAAMSGPKGPLTLTPDGLAAWKEAASCLLRERAVLDRFNKEELWSVLVSLTVTASTNSDPAAFITSSVSRLRNAERALVVILVANATWDRDPITFDDFVIGNADSAFIRAVNVAAGRRRGITAEDAREWLDKQVEPRLGENVAHPVALACWTRGQHQLARSEAERMLRNLVDLTIMLEQDLRKHEVYRRGPTNRPGVRGLTLDRGAIERRLTGPSELELASFPLVFSEVPGGRGVEWFNAEPLPLGNLLDQQQLLAVVRSCFGDDPISSRLRVACRWFSEAHYTLAEDDAALALGVSMDALIGGQRALPGSAMADRFALLDDDPQRRRDRVKSYLDYYGVRSSIAHGGRSSRLDDDGFVAQYQEAVRWAALRLIAMRDRFHPLSEKCVDDLFDDLRWGTQIWI